MVEDGRAGGIRTHDPYTPSVVRYQTALQPVSVNGRAKKQGLGGMASTEKQMTEITSDSPTYGLFLGRLTLDP